MALDIAADSKTLKRADLKIRELRVPKPESPDKKEILSWPSNVGDLSPEELAKHLTWWTGWSSYIRYHLARAETNAAAYEETYKAVEQELIFKSEGDYKTVTQLKAAISQMSSMKSHKSKVLESKAVKKMLSSLLDGYESKYQTISREISRRTHEAGYK